MQCKAAPGERTGLAACIEGQNAQAVYDLDFHFQVNFRLIKGSNDL